MNKMINLVRNENMKLGRSISTWIMIGILVVAIVAVGLIIRFSGNKPTKTDWKTAVTSQIQLDKQNLTDMKDAPKIAQDKILNRIQTNEYRLKNDIPPIESKSLWGFVEGAATSLISLIALFSIIMGGGIVANEFSGGTIKLLLIRPSKRWKILLSKYISVLGYSLLMLLILLVVSFIVGGLFFSFKGVAVPYLTNTNGIISEVTMVAHILGISGLECISLVMMSTLAFMISSLFRNSSMAIGIGVFLLTVGNIITMMLARFDWSKYILFANTNLNQYIDGEPLVKGMTMQFSIVVLIVYFIIFNVISYLGFTKRDITA